MTMQQSSKRFAPESLKTRKTREKLQKYWEEVEKLITSEALREKAEEIHRWIARHAHQRISLRNKNISLFDENQHAAKLSQRVSVIAQKLHEDMTYMAEASPSHKPRQ